MKLELLDAYNVRARLSASIILFAPIAITVFSCFEAIQSFSTSSVLIVVLLAFTNYIPILQHRIHTKQLNINDFSLLRFLILPCYAIPLKTVISTY